MKRLLAVLLGITLVAALGGVSGYYYWQARLDAPLTVDVPTLYQVPPGAGFHRGVNDLSDQGIISDAWAFLLLTRLSPDEVPPIRVGEYELLPEMHGRDLLAVFENNDVVTYSLTVPEGWTFRQMRGELDASPKLEHRTTDMSDADVMALENPCNLATLLRGTSFTLNYC